MKKKAKNDRWATQGEGEYQSWRLKCESPAVVIYAPTRDGNTFSSYIDDKLHSNVYDTFEDVEKAVFKTLRLMSANIQKVLG